MDGLRERIEASVVLPVLFVLLAYLVIGYSQGKPGLDKPGRAWVFIQAGDVFAHDPDLLPHGTKVASGTGYDGQFFFYLSQDPLLSGRVASPDQITSPQIDHVAYRYQRILLPVLGWLASWGDPDVLQWTLPAINLLAVLGAGFLLARFLRARGRSPWLALVFMLSAGMVEGVVRDLSDPLAASLLIAGFVWWLEGRTLLPVIAFAACLLAREVALVPIAAVCALELWRRGRAGLAWLAPVGIWVAWQAYLHFHLAGSVRAAASGPSPVPLLGLAHKIKRVLEVAPWPVANWELAFLALLVAIVAVFIARSIRPLVALARTRRLPGRAELMPIVATATVWYMPFLTLPLLIYIPGFIRYAAPAAGAMVLLYAFRPSRLLLGLMIVLMVLSFTNPIVGMLPTINGPISNG